MHVVATAGHVDHGKSTLVRVLTGTDPDRFAEEKERGLTIDLGFAATTLASGRELSFIDVPGHVRFLKNMLAGVGAVDACLFVVAATESWKPQSEEHLRILELLGVAHGLVALTKVGLCDDDDVELARMDLADRVEGTFLESADVIAVDALTGIGVDDLRAGLDRLLETTPTASDIGRPRLWVDRSFAAKGSGTVVTGTLVGGSINVEDELSVLPSGRRVRVRSLQTHGSTLRSAGPGRRLAVNLTGLSHGEIRRGDVLVRHEQWAPTRTFDASLTVLSGLDHEISRRGAFAAYIGSGEHPAKVRVLGPEALSPGDQGLVRLYLGDALPLVPGDRYILRESGRGETVGGGEVLDVAPVLPASRARPDKDPARIVAERGWVDVDLLSRLTGRPAVADIGRWAVAPAVRTDAEMSLRQAVAGAGDLGLDVAGLSEQHRALLATFDDLEVDNGRAKKRSAAPAAVHPFVLALEAAPFTPPTPEEAGASRAEVRDLVRRDLVVERDGLFFSKVAIERATEIVAEALREYPDGVTASELRDRLGTTRKYLLPLLGHLDANGVTRRRGDLRIAGPRLGN